MYFAQPNKNNNYLLTVRRFGIMNDGLMPEI